VSCVVVLGALGCGPRARIVGPVPAGVLATWSPRDEFCVVEPPDGANGGSVSAGSGRQVADRIVHVVVERWHGKVLLLEGRAVRASSAGRRCAYTIAPTILQWDRHESSLMHGARVTVQIAIERRGASAPLRSVRFEMNVRRPAVFGAGSIVLPPQFDDAVIRLLSPD